jgi:NAD(P)-dependent dehydrogenase (short-subunit alcohol dehydrogenase family)
LKEKLHSLLVATAGSALRRQRRFVAEGARVAITGRDAATLAATANELGVTAIKSDVLDPQARSSLFDRIKNEFGHLDILFANGESSAYAASKAGVRAMCRSLAGELSPRGIRVNAVVPGVIETPIWGRTAVPPEAAAARERRLQAMIPLNRIGRAEDIASAVLFLASDEAAYIQGTELVVDGGVLGSAGAAPAHRR